MKKFVVMVLAVLALVLFAAVAWAEPALSVYVGDTFEVPLIAAPSTGYGWFMLSFDKEFVEQIGQSYFRRVDTKDRTGTVEQQVFRFKALKEGSTELVFEEKRESKKDVRQTVTVKIEITQQSAGLILDHPWTKSVVLIGSLGFGGMGTGFIVSEDGYVVTANHVVDEFGMVVVFPEPLLYRLGRLVYADELHDIAVLKVDASGLRALSVGQLDGNKIGDPVFALGHPYGIGWVLTQGVLSSVKYDRDGYAYLLSDVEIEPGSSGSPILNAQGEVIGMVQQGAEGIAIGIAADKFVRMITAAILADQELAKTRAVLERLQERARREWKRVMEPKD